MQTCACDACKCEHAADHRCDYCRKPICAGCTNRLITTLFQACESCFQKRQGIEQPGPWMFAVQATHGKPLRELEQRPSAATVVVPENA